MEFFSPRRWLVSIIVLFFAWSISYVIFPLELDSVGLPMQQPPAVLSTEQQAP